MIRLFSLALSIFFDMGQK